jgi:hypothetical protein
MVVLGLAGWAAASVSPAEAQAGDRPFQHAAHGAFECGECHGTETSHGVLLVRAPRDCLECHHAQRRVQPCSRCHDAGRFAARTYSRAATIRVDGAPARTRELPFDHSRHEAVDCVTCHVTPVTLDPAPVACTTCHEQHHRPAAQCVQCHPGPPVAAHPREAHVTCAGTSCHDSAEFVTAERTRPLCLVCHRDMSDHEPGGACANCHILPPWRSSPRPAG